MSVKIIKLTGGEDIIAGFEEKEDKVVLQNPAKIMLIPTDDEGMGMGLALIPWLPYTDDKEIEIEKEFVITSVFPIQDILNEYNQQFGVGIVVPPKDIIL